MNVMGCLKNKTDYVRNIIPLEKRNKDMVFALVLLGLTMNNFNVAATFTTSVSIQEKFNSTSTTTSWVLSAYSLTLGSFILIFGKISDILGPHNIFLFGLTMIWLCSLISAVITDSIIALIVFRALQGVGAAALVPSGFAMAGNYYSHDTKKLGKAISGLIVALTASFGVGTVVGGAFDSTKLGYKSLYYFVFAFTLIVNVGLFLLIIPVTKTEKHKELKLSNLDFPGVFLFVVGILLIILGLTEGGTQWNSPTAYVPLPVGILVVASVFLFEFCHIRGFQIKNEGINTEQLNNYGQWRMKLILLFPPECVKITNFVIFLIATALYYMVFTIAMTAQVQYHLFVEENSPIIASLKVLPLSVALALSAFIYTKERYEKIGVKLLLVLSSLVSLGCYIWLSFLKYDIHNAYWKFEFVSIFFLGIGTNIYFNIYLNVVLTHTPLHLQGAVSGIFQTFSQVPLCIANAIVASILGSITYASNPAEKQALHNKFMSVHYVGIALLVVIVLALSLARDVSLSKPKVELQNLDLEKDLVLLEAKDTTNSHLDLENTE